MGSFLRPDPEELLRRVETENRRVRRGRLKVFLGYAPRVGKSLRMLDEGLRRKSRGQDVVVGGVQAKGSASLTGQLSAFEVIPLVHTGDEDQSLDVQAILRRNPGVCLIDELAYANPKGAACAERWQEVEQLLDAGVNVVTCINLQHVREQQDAVAAITGKRAPCAVPEAFLRSADELVIVDAPSESLPNDAGSAPAPSVPDPRQLSHLRELALLLAAEIVDCQLQRYLAAHGLQHSWGTKERILVCITSRSNVRNMIAAGQRNAERSHGQLLAVTVKPADLGREAGEMLDGNLAYARKLGAEVHVLTGSGEPIAQLLEFAKSQSVTQMFVGHTQKPSWKFWAVSPLQQLIEAADGIDVRVFPHAPTA